MNSEQNTWFRLHGNAEGTTYSIIYNDKKGRDLKLEIDLILEKIERSLSVYDNDSLISKINRNELVEPDDYFLTVFKKAKDVYEKTSGAFDISAEPLFRAWGFSFEKREKMTPSKVAKLKKVIGMDEIEIDNRQIVKSSPDVVLNMNSIAKGYSVDVVAEFLETCEINNFLVEIGGEIRLKGVNEKGMNWIVGVDKPMDGNHVPGRHLQTYLQLTDKAIATSGEYRRFYIDENNKRISHTIDPRTGYPVTHNLRSVTVIAEDSMTADSFATAFIVIGLEKSREYLKKSKDLEAMFIYEEDNVFKMECSDNISRYIIGD